MTGSAPAPRIPALDIARGAALCGMVVYHFTYDLELFGLIAPGTAVSGGWFVLARVVAASFLFLAGVSLWLAHGAGIRWPGFGRRLATVGAAAAAISAGSWFAIPEAWVFFGILHAIACGSLAGL
ncbi:MAG TPA: heparan-alpha-glucosaminide N-acetyltransferase domain-containing protein, partial [Paracoccaceae bacterium]|nr:heparan-alpha-glucosaminide N-acetyltransferase domain-containing protein [Paracoccaceae bacterium]